MRSPFKFPVYRLKKSKSLFGFGDNIGDIPFGEKSLGQWQIDIFKSFGVSVQDINNENEIKESQYLIFDNDLFFTAPFIKQVYSHIHGTDSLSFKFLDNTFNDRFLLAIDGNGKRLTPSIFFKIKGKENLKNIIIDQKVYEFILRVPTQIIKGNDWHCDQCNIIAGAVHTPFHVLQLNMAFNFSRMVKLQKNCPAWVRERYIKKGSRLFNWSLRSLNRIHKSARIHPSAVIEGSIIGANVEVGANSVVRGSIVGEGTTIEDCVVCNYCVLGANNYLSSSNYINLCMTYEDVYLIHGPYQFSIYGRNVATMAVINCDFRLDQKGIKIDSPNGVIDTNQTLLGIAYGHHSVVGGGNIIAAGRIVPNDYKQIPPSFIITKFND